MSTSPTAVLKLTLGQEMLRHSTLPLDSREKLAARIDDAITQARNAEHLTVTAIPIRHAIAELQRLRYAVVDAIEALQESQPQQSIGALDGYGDTVNITNFMGEVLYTAAVATLAEAVKEAVRKGISLRNADLRNADLSGAVLSGAVLRNADLRNADLSGAVLSGAVLRNAVLSGAVLSGAVLSGADLRPIRDDFWAILCSAPSEVPALRLALVEGRVDGSTYSGECACLVGTLANAKHCRHTEIPGLSPDSGRPAERFFLSIKIGDTPETRQEAKIAVAWIDEWTNNMRAAFAPDAK